MCNILNITPLHLYTLCTLRTALPPRILLILYVPLKRLLIIFPKDLAWIEGSDTEIPVSGAPSRLSSRCNGVISHTEKIQGVMV